jgi:hypothetical protein
MIKSKAAKMIRKKSFFSHKNEENFLQQTSHTHVVLFGEDCERKGELTLNQKAKGMVLIAVFVERSRKLK